MICATVAILGTCYFRDQPLNASPSCAFLVLPHHDPAAFLISPLHAFFGRLYTMTCRTKTTNMEQMLNACFVQEILGAFVKLGLISWRPTKVRISRLDLNHHFSSAYTMHPNKRLREDTFAGEDTGEAAVTRSDKYYIPGGDLVCKAENTLFRVHSYHFMRASPVYCVYSTQRSPLESFNDTHPLNLAIRAQDAAALMWFFYDSPYNWVSGDNTIQGLFKASTWESIMLAADKLIMPQIARVACHTLDHLHRLSDARKVALGIRYRLGRDWVAPNIRRLLRDENSLKEEDVCVMGPRMTVLVVRGRELLLRRHMVEVLNQAKTTLSCAACLCDSKGPPRPRLRHLAPSPNASGTQHHAGSECHQQHEVLPNDAPSDALVDSVIAMTSLFQGVDNAPGPPPSASRCFRKGIPNGDIFIQVEDRKFQMHSYPLIRASPFFANMFSVPLGNGQIREGFTADCPIKLDIRAHDFENLLYFFYDSAYERLPGAVDPTAIPMWESTLHLADMFNMREVKEVALHALGRPGALTDVHKVALCMRYNVPRTWAETAFLALCTRKQAPTWHEMAELTPAVADAIVQAREELLRRNALAWMAPDAIQQIVNKRFLERPATAAVSGKTSIAT